MATPAITTEHEPDALLRRAQEAAYRLPADFAGFVAEVRWATDRVRAAGTVRVTGPTAVDLRRTDGDPEDPDDGAYQAALRELASLVGHRWAQPYEEGDGRWGKRFGADDGSLGGRAVILEGDPFSSSYRVADALVGQVDRRMGTARFSIVIHARTAAPDGRCLPAHFSVYHWAADSGRLTRAESFHDTYVDVGDVALPGSRRVVAATDRGLERRELHLAGHALLAGDRP